MAIDANFKKIAAGHYICPGKTKLNFNNEPFNRSGAKGADQQNNNK